MDEQLGGQLLIDHGFSPGSDPLLAHVTWGSQARNMTWPIKWITSLTLTDIQLPGHYMITQGVSYIPSVLHCATTPFLSCHVGYLLGCSFVIDLSPNSKSRRNGRGMIMFFEPHLFIFFTTHSEFSFATKTLTLICVVYVILIILL